MAGGASVLEDGSVLSRLDRSLLKAETLLALLSGLAVFMLMGGRSGQCLVKSLHITPNLIQF